MTLFYFECPQALGISRVDRWNNFYLSALTEYDKNWQECPHAKFLLTRLLRGATETNRNIDSVKFISTHTPLARRDGVIWRTSEAILNFYSHASCEARPSLEKEITDSENFYSLASCEARLIVFSMFFIFGYFYSHASCEARRNGMNMLEIARDFYSHASCEARHKLAWAEYMRLDISTHTPLARRDVTGSTSSPKMRPFLLTRLLRGATIANIFSNNHVFNFYSHASCEARRLNKRTIRISG